MAGEQPRKEDKAEDKEDGNTIWKNRKIIPLVALKSRTLICYFTNAGSFVVGFGYENGSNARVKCLKYNALIKKYSIVNKTTHRGFVLAFPDCMTSYESTKAFPSNYEKEIFTNADFDFRATWFKIERQNQAEKELKKVEDQLSEDGETIGELVSLFSQLDTGEKEKHMKQLKKNVEKQLKTKETVEKVEKTKHHTEE